MMSEAMAAVHTVGAVWAKLIAAHLKTEGLPVEEILGKAGINHRTLNQKNPRILFRQHAALLDLAAEAVGDDCFGLHLAARKVDIRDAGVLAYVGLSSKTLGEAIQNLARYLSVLNEAARINLELSRELAVVGFEFDDPTARGHRQATEFGTANLVGAFRLVTRRDLHPVEVTFAHPRNHQIAAFERFFGCPVQFGRRRSFITFTRRQLMTPVAAADDRLLAVLTEYCEEILAGRRRKSPDIRHETERLIVTLLPRGEADTETVSHELGMSVRTMSRRLKETGATFAEILDELRADLARKYLGDASLGVAEIAYLLGYSDVSAFSHAFKRWTGKTPGQMR